MESKRAVPTFNSVAAEIGELVTSKNEAYGDSFAKCGEFLRLLYPTGLEPSKYGDALSMVRIFDKQMRIATRKDAFGESPYNDICGYGLLGATADAKAAMFHTPLSPDQVEGITAALCPPPLCDTCIRDPSCGMKEAMAPSLANGACVQYLPREGDGEGVAKAMSLCADCARWDCNAAIKGRDVAQCGAYIQPEPSTSCRDCWSDCGVAGEGREAAECQSHTPMAEGLKLPTITVEGSVEDVRKKWREEFREWKDADDTSILKWVEAWDVIQVMQTLKERDSLLPVCSITAEMESYHKEDSERLESARRAMLMKNACRTRPDGGTGYYAPEVCERIIVSGGKEW